jgi:methylmalonyl-CoA mutase N-terminal domain/subunit
MQRLFDGIRLDTISTSMTINATAARSNACAATPHAKPNPCFK